jgi:uncharacterized protein involved in outer membrane biogenesis
LPDERARRRAFPADISRTMSKSKRRWSSRWSIGVGIFAAFIIVLVLVWNWDWFKPIAESRASAALGRKVTMQHLVVHLRWHPIIDLDGLQIENPPDFPGGGRFATADRLTIQINPWPLFHGRVVLPLIDLEHLHGELSAPENAKPNWTLPSGGTKSSGKPPAISIGQIIIHDSTLHVLYPRYKADMNLAIDTERPAVQTDNSDRQQRIHVKLDGSYADSPISGHLIGGSVLALSNAGHPYPIDFDIVNGKTELVLKGTLTDPMKLGGADVKVHLTGNSMADLYPLTSVPLPPTAPYSIGGHLNYAHRTFRFTDFAGRVGKSDLEGEIAVDLNPTPRKISMTLHSKAVDMKDLGGFIGAKPRHKDESTKSNPSILPNTPINLPELRSADLDVNYTAGNISGQNMPLDDLTAHLVTHEGKVTVAPLDFGVGGGSIKSHVFLDGTGGTVHLRMAADFRRLSFGHVIRKSAGYQGNGRIGGYAALDGTGHSAAEIAANGNGDFKLFMSGGDISALLVDLAGLELGKSVFAAIGLPDKTKLRCMVADWALDDGIVNTKLFLIDTTTANIIGNGTLNFKKNSIDYKIMSRSKHFTIGALNTPIKITGPVKDPSISPNVKKLGERGGIAAALAAIATPLAALIPTIQLGLGKDNNCGELIHKAKSGSLTQSDKNAVIKK